MKIRRIIARLDIKGPNLVKGIHLEGLRVMGTPEVFAKHYYNQGVDELIYSDVVASLYQRNNLTSLIKNTSENIFLPMLAGGGIKNINEVEAILKSGADRIFLNTAAIDNPNIINDIVKKFGSSTLVVSFEVVKSDNKFFCRKDFGREETKKELMSWVKEVEIRGAGEIIITSIDTDGTGLGFDLKLAEKLSEKIKVPYILNGGISSIKQIDDLLNCSNPSGIAIGSALHYSYIDQNFKKKNFMDGNVDFLKNNKNYRNFGKLKISNIKNYLKKKIKK